MNRRGRRNNRNRGNLRAQVDQLSRMVSRLRVVDTYRFPRGRFDPPRIVTNPRWSFVLDTTIIQQNAGTQTLANASVRTGVRGQLGLPQTFEDFELYYQRVDIWTTPLDTINSGGILALRICDLENGAFTQWLEDQGTVARPGHVHAIWPRSQQVQPRSSTVFNVLQVDSPEAFTGVLHVHLQISFTAGDVIPTVRRRLATEFSPHPCVL